MAKLFSLRAVAVGSAAGTIAAFAMAGVEHMWSASSAARHQSQDEIISREVAERIFHTITRKRIKQQCRAGLAVHYVVGTLTGGLYGLAIEQVPDLAMGCGTVFGAAFFLVANKFVAPSLGLLPPSAGDNFWLNIEAILSHVTYATTLESVRRAMTPKH